MSALSAVIVDDEPAAREGIRLRLDSHPDIEIVGECRNADLAAELIARVEPDLVFLDVEMPGTTGIEMIQRMPERLDPAIVLVTAYSEFALEAFDVDVVDFLLKPIDDHRFDLALDRARRHVKRAHDEKLAQKMRSLLIDASSQPLPPPDAHEIGSPFEPPEAAIQRFLVRHNGREVAIDIAKIRWIEAAGDYVRLHSAEGDFMVRDSLSHVESRLPGSFGRVHRSALVRFDEVHELRPTAHGDFDVVLHNGQSLRMSRTYRDSFRQGLETAVVEG